MTVAAILTVAGIVAVLSMPIDPGWSSDEDAVFVHVEFEPGASADSVDARLSAYARELSAVFGVLHVQSTARRGSGIVMASFDRKRTDLSSVVNAIKSIKVSGGFAWVQSGSPHERTFELIVAGEDDSECRRLATIAAQAVSTLPFVRETVLNFKDGPDDLIMTLDRDKAAGMGVGFSRAAGALRRSVHGPVAYKRLEESGEMDVRVTVARAGVSTPADVAGTLIATDNGSIRVDSIMKFSRKSDASRIHRRDRRRIASITMRSEPVDPRKAASAIKNTLSGVDRPAGYAFEFDRAALQKAETIRGTGWSFAVAALLAYMVTATVTESFGAPIAILAALPPSLAVPAVLHAAAGKPFDAAVACAFVAVSGMVVNASVLTVDERRSRGALSRIGASDLYSIIRARSRSLLATCGTTVAGALPFLFLKDTGSAMVRSLSFVAAAGTAASFVFALTVIPALSVAAPSLFATFMLKENKIKGRDT